MSLALLAILALAMSSGDDSDVVDIVVKEDKNRKDAQDLLESVGASAPAAVAELAAELAEAELSDHELENLAFFLANWTADGTSPPTVEGYRMAGPAVSIDGKSYVWDDVKGAGGTLGDGQTTLAEWAGYLAFATSWSAWPEYTDKRTSLAARLLGPSHVIGDALLGMGGQTLT